MFNLLIISILTVIFHFASGALFLKFLRIKTEDSAYYYSITSFLGIIFISFFALILNFILPLDPFLNTFLYFLIITNFLFLLKDIKKKNELIKFVIFASLGIFLLLLLSNIYRPDAGLYHYPYINILNENKIIIGISNLHQRFGHISILQYLSASHYNFIFGLNGIVIPSASLAIYVIINLISNILRIKSFSFSKIFSILILLYVSYKMNRYSEYGNDAAAHFTFFLIFSVYLNSIENNFLFKKNEVIYLISILSIFAFLNKTFLILALIIPFLINTKFLLKNLFNYKFIFISLFLYSWIVQSYLTTGCGIYPMPITCLDFSWTNFDYLSNVYDVAIGSEAWAKDWSNQKGEVLTYNEYLSNFGWIKIWFNNQFFEVVNIVGPYLILILLFILFLYFYNYKNIIIKKKFNNDYIYLLTLSFFGMLLWFFKAPIYRYGYSYLITFLALIFSYFIFYYFSNLKPHKVKKISNIIIVFCVVILIGKQFIRISKNYEYQYVNYPWPKFNSFDRNNNKAKIKTIFKNGEVFYYRPSSNYCFYSKSPCTSVGVDDNLKYKNIYSYKIYYFKP